MAVNRHRSGPYVAVVQAYKRPRCGSQHAHTWQSTDTYMAIDRHIHGSQHAHTQQSHAHDPYVAVVRVYKRYRVGNKNEHKLVA